MDYTALDHVGQKLFRLYPDEFGLLPQNTETYIALAVRDYFMVLPQEERVAVIRRLIIPQSIGITVDAELNTVNIQLTAADINRGLLELITLYAVQMTLQELRTQTESLLEGAVEGADESLAAGLRVVTAGALRRSYETFEPENMSKNLEPFLRELYLIIISGGE